MSTNTTDKTQKMKTKTVQNSRDTQFFPLSKCHSWHIFTQFFKKCYTRGPLIMRVYVHAQKCVPETKTDLSDNFSQSLHFSCVWEKDTRPMRVVERVCVCV